MTTPLTDFTRFPGRRWANSVAARMPPKLAADTRMAMAVAARWSHHLRARPEDIVLFATAQDAMRAAVHALLAPDDVALLALPLAPEWLTAVLCAGARYVDVGRRFDGPTPTGAWNRNAAERAAAAHPDAVALVESLSWSGSDDAAAIAGLPLRAVIADARRVQSPLGPVLLPDRPTLTLVALRDPDCPSEPVLHALVAPDGQGRALGIAIGPTSVPDLLADHAFAVLDGVERWPDWQAQLVPRLEARYGQWLAALAGRPGVQILGRSGVEAAALCLSDDADVIAAAIADAFPAVRAWPMTPMRALLTLDLLR